MIEIKGLMYNFDKEGKCKPILLVFVMNLGSYINKQKILHGTIQIDLEFVVWENRQVGRNLALDVAMVVFYDENDKEALPLILYQLKSSVHPVSNHEEKADLIELMIQNYYCLDRHKCKYIIGCALQTLRRGTIF